MNDALYHMVLERLVEDEDIDDSPAAFVDAACTSDAEFAEALAGTRSPTASLRERVASAKVVEPPGTYLQSLSVAAFRGIGPAVQLELEPGPGLTVIVGRNGTGKSSFAEALETLLTGDCRRWSARRQKVWSEGWRNLHRRSDATIEAKFIVEGSPAPMVVQRKWADDGELEDGKLRIRKGDQGFEEVRTVPWDEALRTFRPLLSYAELGTLLDEPSQLYDSLEAILGLEELTTARERLHVARKGIEDEAKLVAKEIDPLRAQLAASSDPRAKICADALAARKWRLDEIEAVLRGTESEEDQTGIALLRQIGALTGPDLTALDAAAKGLLAATQAEVELAGTATDRNDQLAQLLEQAIRFRKQFDGDCPVCGGGMEADWEAKALVRIEEARKLNTDARKISDDKRRCTATLRQAIRPAPPVLERLADVALPEDALHLWRRWADAPADPLLLERHIDEVALRLDEALTALRERAKSELATRENAWRPFAERLGTWLGGARRVAQSDAKLKALKQAETWMKKTEEALRDRRFEPIANRSQQIWSQLRQNSDVELAHVELEGSKTRRHVKLNVSVDGQDSAALAVMSQGELNALALSLFLPRMTLAESPFRFLVIDDPVQAMDPHKVDGLAMVLGAVAKERQVIVLTHDPRLLEAIRRLAIPARAIEVQRRSGSMVQLAPLLDAVDRHLDDARAITKSPEVPTVLVRRLVAGFCRSAIEAASLIAVRRRRLGRGETHADVEDVIHGARGTMPLVALALFDDPERGGEVYARLNRSVSSTAGNALRACKEGAHHDVSIDPERLIREADDIASFLRAS